MISRRQMLVLAGAAPFWSVLKPSAAVQGPSQAARNRHRFTRLSAHGRHAHGLYVALHGLQRERDILSI